jgi:ABC-type antimicrobial peptide transport system permease subunit
MIDPIEWRDIAYMDREWILFPEAFEVMDESDTNALLEMGAGMVSGVVLGDPWLIKLGDRVHTFSLVGFFGREPPPNWQVQSPTLYIHKDYGIKERYLGISRILVKLKEEANKETIKAEIEALDPVIQGVDVTETIISSALNNIFLAGPRRIQELGVYFAAIVSSVGIVLIVSTAMRSRLKELTVMAIRGFSNRQLTVTLLIENLGMTLFSILLGLGVGLMMLRGETEIFNASLNFAIEKRIVFPPSAQLTLLAVTGLLIASTIVPILVMVRQVSEKPLWRIQE